MKKSGLYLIFFVFCSSFCQDSIVFFPHSNYYTPEILIGSLSEPNTDFPLVGIQKTLYLSLGKYQQSNRQEWAFRLNYPKTGVSFGFSDYGNLEQVGRTYSMIPFSEFNLLKSKRFKIYFGLGIAYHNVQYDIKSNPNNKGITTDFTWAFRSALYYDLLKSKTSLLRLNLNYLHHSNGHVKLPNQGFNSFLLGVSLEKGYNPKESQHNYFTIPLSYERNIYSFYSFRTGIGQNVLSEVFNTKKQVYTAAFSYGKVINNTYKFDLGFYYRFYEHYFDYIKNEEELIVERYPQFINNPFGYATNFGLFGSGELLLNHVGIEFQLGLNIYKPFYQVDWILNQGYVFIAYDVDNEPYIAVKYGELDWYYEVKRTVSSRLGLKYYLLATDKQPIHNFFIAAHINANLGQADFNELSFGYVYKIKSKR